MASIENAVLSISHDKNKKTADVLVKCDVKFTNLELCQMKSCQGRWFKLKCQLWGEDSGLTGNDDHLFTSSEVIFFPDINPTAIETKTFRITVGEGVLDEDWGVDEVFALLILTNLNSMVQVKKKTNVVSHSF